MGLGAITLCSLLPAPCTPVEDLTGFLEDFIYRNKLHAKVIFACQLAVVIRIYTWTAYGASPNHMAAL